jgi:hypothetical protein
VPFIIRQQVQPAFIMPAMHSQHDWIMSQQALSPLVHVMVMPLGVISHLHRPIVRLQQQTIMPFIMQQTEHMPPASMVHRFCIMLHAVASSQVQVIFIPPWHFSIFMVQRGTIIMFMAVGMPMAVPMPVAPAPIMPVRSIIIVLVMIVPSLGER